MGCAGAHNIGAALWLTSVAGSVNAGECWCSLSLVGVLFNDTCVGSEIREECWQPIDKSDREAQARLRTTRARPTIVVAATAVHAQKETAFGFNVPE